MSRYFSVLGESISQSTLVKYVQLQWQGWGKKSLIPAVRRVLYSIT
ncbi:Uncharacterised protein [Leclercia adecarboxylata]|uniref:Uncharacterized protein n=1 Tax=Leclercia adecarboxylata TaxID=83655 RepID=A0A4U9HGA0_9ENTR|nr:Uncharacterised protein [Leclercia adecarboxylata]